MSCHSACVVSDPLHIEVWLCTLVRELSSTITIHSIYLQQCTALRNCSARDIVFGNLYVLGIMFEDPYNTRATGCGMGAQPLILKAVTGTEEKLVGCPSGQCQQLQTEDTRIDHASDGTPGRLPMRIARLSALVPPFTDSRAFQSSKFDLQTDDLCLLLLAPTMVHTRAAHWCKSPQDVGTVCVRKFLHTREGKSGSHYSHVTVTASTVVAHLSDRKSVNPPGSHALRAQPFQLNHCSTRRQAGSVTGRGGGTSQYWGFTTDNLHSTCVSLTPMPLTITLVNGLRTDGSSGVADGAWPAIVKAAQ